MHVLARWGSRGDIVLRWLPWAILGVGLIAAPLQADSGTGRVNPITLLAWTAAFFALLVLRLALTIRSAPGRRAVVSAFLAGLVLWLGGTYVLSVSEATTTVSFPGPGEWLFLSACLFFAVFVFLDAQPSTALRSTTAWVDAVMLCGGAAAVSAAVLLPPLARVYSDGGTALLIALVYPVFDVVLALMVIAQWALGMRRGGVRTALLIAGFVVLALADTSLVLGVPSGTYTFSYVPDILWPTSFALLVESVCTSPESRGLASRRSVPTVLLIAGFVVALILLVIHPEGAVGTVIAISSAVVLAAAGFRLLLALRSAQAASDALRISAVDDLTGLPNRRALLRRVDDLRAARSRGGLILLDVDRFQEVNDAIGHSVGDYLLRLLAGRLSELVPSGALLSRTGGDEFAVLVATDDPVVLGELAVAMRSRAAEPVEVDGLVLNMHLTAGAATLLSSDVMATDVLRRADVAQYAARAAGTGYEIYHGHSDVFTRSQLELAHSLRAAVRAKDLAVYYLPMVDANTGAVSSLEALVRWEHPQEGMIAPARFLPLARREGLMLELSEQVAEQAISDLAAWRAAGLDVGVSINVAPTELLDGVLVPYIERCVDAAGVEPRWVTLEVTEDSFRVEPDHARRALLEAGAAGLRTSIDDYGSGFSSLSYLRDLPVAEVKLDRTFFAAVVSDSRSAVIVSSTVAMAHALGMRVVAEGVETEYVASRAIVLGVDSLQGFYLSPALPAGDVPAFVELVAIGGSAAR